ncbi:hypothetical protein PAXRUDRAFT_804151 [Paxillus rubicundulus Ve08.2h10]|uniref:Unplaced genomic scaffold scaffold_789, whole genome shotgun sequence n=1 Tax=Paxillus rubicundulus Ve08.2h10 TaxID=930991 RepID=A0A0D0D3L7_9AGAM|nr:hypothetical protein PAXRUDRAFT_804151 [Paxillus rubicundulus Ve08.2h10]
MAPIPWPTHAPLAISHGPSHPQRAPLHWAGLYPMAPIPQPTHAPLAISHRPLSPMSPPLLGRPVPHSSHPLAHPSPLGHPPLATPYTMDNFIPGLTHRPWEILPLSPPNTHGTATSLAHSYAACHRLSPSAPHVLWPR